MFNKVASSVTNTAKNTAQKHVLNQVNKLGLEDKAIGALGTAASGYTAGIVNKDDIGRIANLAKNPNKEGLMNAVTSNATVGKALNNPLLRKAAAAHELAQTTLNNPAVAAAVSHASSAVAHPAVKAATNAVARPAATTPVAQTTTTKQVAQPNTGGKYKKKRKSSKRKTRKNKRKTRKNKRKI
jgi:hypothetical protein